MRGTMGVKSSKRQTTIAIGCHLCGLEGHDVACTKRLGDEQKQGKMKGGAGEGGEGMEVLG